MKDSSLYQLNTLIIFIFYNIEKFHDNLLIKVVKFWLLKNLHHNKIFFILFYFIYIVYIYISAIIKFIILF